jgi:hypothetical protein
MASKKVVANATSEVDLSMLETSHLGFPPQEEESVAKRNGKKFFLTYSQVAWSLTPQEELSQLEKKISFSEHVVATTSTWY